MQTVPLSPKLSDVPHPIERGEEAAIAGEIARHLLDYREATSASRCASFLQKLVAIHTVEPAALWVVLRLLSGDMGEITRSYADIGKENGRAKQAVQQELERVLVALQAHYPQAAAAIIQLRCITAKIGPIAYAVNRKL